MVQQGHAAPDYPDIVSIKLDVVCQNFADEIRRLRNCFGELEDLRLLVHKTQSPRQTPTHATATTERTNSSFTPTSVGQQSHRRRSWNSIQVAPMAVARRFSVGLGISGNLNDTLESKSSRRWSKPKNAACSEGWSQSSKGTVDRPIQEATTKEDLNLGAIVPTMPGSQKTVCPSVRVHRVTSENARNESPHAMSPREHPSSMNCKTKFDSSKFSTAPAPCQTSMDDSGSRSEGYCSETENLSPTLCKLGTSRFPFFALPMSGKDSPSRKAYQKSSKKKRPAELAGELIDDNSEFGGSSVASLRTVAKDICEDSACGNSQCSGSRCSSPRSRKTARDADEEGQSLADVGNASQGFPLNEASDVNQEALSSCEHALPGVPEITPSQASLVHLVASSDMDPTKTSANYTEQNPDVCVVMPKDSDPLLPSGWPLRQPQIGVQMEAEKQAIQDPKQVNFLPCVVPTTPKQESNVGEQQQRHQTSGNLSDSFQPFEPLSMWVSVSNARLPKTSRRISVSRHSRVMGGCASLETVNDMFAVSTHNTESESGHQSRWSRFESIVVIAPTSFGCFIWDVISMIFILYDLIYLPLQIFNPPDTTVATTMDWITRIYWTISLPRNFCLGFLLPDGQVEFRLQHICRHYIFGWFAFDLLVVFSDWAEVLMEGMDFVSALRLTKTLRFSRVMRVVRLARMAKLPSILEEFDARVFSEKTTLYLGVLKITFLMVVASHVSACTWYGIGEYSSSFGQSWPEEFGIQKKSLGYQYMTSLHWAVTQYIGTMEVYPQNMYERSYATLLLILNFVLAAAFVSRITASMTRLQIITGSHDQQLRTLRLYLRHHSVSQELSLRVVRGAQHALKMQDKYTHEQDIGLLSLISEPIREAIHYEIYAPILKFHLLFNEIDWHKNSAMKKLCHEGVEMITLNVGDLLFMCGEVPKDAQMFFVMTGIMVYTRLGSSVMVSREKWVCEGAIWTSWTHVGDLCASVDCNMIRIDAETMARICKTTHNIGYQVTEYASAFIRHMNQNWEELTDLTMESFEIEKVVADSFASNTRPSRQRSRRASIASSISYRSRASSSDRRSLASFRSSTHSTVVAKQKRSNTLSSKLANLTKVY